MTASRGIRRRGFTTRVGEVPEGPERRRRQLHFFVRWNKYVPGMKGRPTERARFFDTRERAQAYADGLQELWRKRPPDKFPTVDVPTDSVAAFAKRWWKEYLAREVTAATRSNYKGALRHIIGDAAVAQVLEIEPRKDKKTWLDGDEIGRMTVSAITPALVILFHQRMYDRGLSLPTRRHVHTCLGALLFYAKCCGLLAGGDNPCREMSKKMRKRNEQYAEPQPNPMTVEDAEAFLAWTKAHATPAEHAYFQFLHDEGTRPGEASALKWSKVAFDDARATIDENFSPDLLRERQKTGPWPASGDKPTKTYQARGIDLTDEVIVLLSALRRDQAAAALRRGRKPPIYVFTTRTHTQLCQNGNVTRVMKTGLAALKLSAKKYSLYSLRDTFATSHLVEHWDQRLAWVSQQLGHKNPETTRRHYYKFTPTRTTRGFANQIRNRGR
jgi:integrase